MQQYHISEDKLQQLQSHGAILLHNAIPQDILSRLKDVASSMESAIMQAHNEHGETPHACIADDPDRPKLMRIDDIYHSQPDMCLDLLACPALLAIFHDCCGPDALPLQLDLLFKQPHPHPIILWHQGAPHPRNYPYLNVGIYLDDADSDDGCLRVVPKTQDRLQDITGLSKQHGWQIPEAYDIPAKAGDIIAQDMMILHGSPPKFSQGSRRTLYLEIRPAAGIAESGMQNEQWVRSRERWMALILRRAAARGADISGFKHYQFELGSDEEELNAIHSLWQPPIPAVYSAEYVVTDSYPVPLR